MYCAGIIMLLAFVLFRVLFLTGWYMYRFSQPISFYSYSTDATQGTPQSVKSQSEILLFRFVTHGASMSLVPHISMRLILILTLGRHGLTGIDRRPQTPRTPRVAIHRVRIVVLALVEPERAANRRRARLAAPVVSGQETQTGVHGSLPGRGGRGGKRRRVAAFVVAGGFGVVAGVGRVGMVGAVAVLRIGQ